MKREIKRLRVWIGSVLAVAVAAASLPAAFAAGEEGGGLWAEYYSGRNFHAYVARPTACRWTGTTTTDGIRLVFMDNDSTWFQPPAYVTQMAHDSYQPNLIDSRLDRTVPNLNYVASRSDDGVLTLKFTNSGNGEIGLLVLLKGVDAGMDKVTVTTLTADNLSDKNTADNPEFVRPYVKTLEKGVGDNKVLVTVAARSYTVVKMEKAVRSPRSPEIWTGTAG